MSNELTKARAFVSAVTPNVKQRKLVPAVNSLYEGISILMRNPLMKAEREEFSRLIEGAVYQLSIDQELKKVYPLVIGYEPGREKDLLNTLRDILNVLTSETTDKVKEIIADRDKRKQEILLKVQGMLDRGEASLAKSTADRLVADFASDISLRADIADRFLRAECYPEAFAYLEEALQQDPEAIYLYNRIGIVLRKMRDFLTAEKYYMRALEFTDQDEYLLFNIGRMYADWRRWSKVKEYAEKALAINEDFDEAKKMLAFAEKKIGAE